MKPTLLFGIILVIVVILIGTIMVLNRKKPNEGFASGAIYGDMADNRNDYINQGKQKYNVLSDSYDIVRGNYVASNVPGDIDAANQDLLAAMQSSDVDLSQFSDTLLGIKPVVSSATLSPSNRVLENAKKCEKVTGRDACAKLDSPEFDNCGVCIKGGTPFTINNPGKHIGGLFITDNDVEDAKDNATGTGQAAQYSPSIGGCPVGMFHVEREECEKQVNRVECAESGETGGFVSGKTIEGKIVVNKKCAKIAGTDTFVYEPKTRKFQVALRALTPMGSGICKITVLNSLNQQVGYGMSKTPGVEFRIVISGVSEGEPLSIYVLMENGYTYGGVPEIFQIQTDGKRVAADAADICSRFGAQVATNANLQEAQKVGAQVCAPGWTKDGVLAWPSQTMSQMCGNLGVNVKQDGKAGDVWCFGVKPPQSNNMEIPVRIANWYEDLSKTGTYVNVVNSKMGDNYVNNFARAVLLQWEMATGNSVRTVAINPTMIGIDGMAPSSTSKDGFKSFNNLREFGNFARSSIIRSPVWSPTANIVPTAVWIWGTRPLSQKLNIQAMVPGIFADSYYKDDFETTKAGPLIANPITEQLLQMSPCLQPGSGPGNYSLDCLKNTFVVAGGDITKGALATKNGGLYQLNAIGSLQNIQDYLDDLYTIASTGKRTDGTLVTGTPMEVWTTINNASNLMFGKNMASPCEKFQADANGNIQIITQSGSNINSLCLDYLWANTGSNFSKGENDADRLVKNTYEKIGQRYSGIRNGEGPPSLQTTNRFETCQRVGEMAPINQNGDENPNAIKLAQANKTVAGIQSYYNKIYQNANAPVSGTDPVQMMTQKSAISQCYGVTKKPRAFNKTSYGLMEGFENPNEDEEFENPNMEGFENPNMEGYEEEEFENLYAEGFENSSEKKKKKKFTSNYEFSGVWDGVTFKPITHASADGNSMVEAFVSVNPKGYDPFNIGLRYPKPNERLTPNEAYGRCANYNRGTATTNNVEIPYDGDRRFSSVAVERGSYEQRGLVPKGFKDDPSKNACKLGGLQSAIPEGTAVIVGLANGTRFLGFDKRTNLALTFDKYEDDTCKMLIRYPIEGDRNTMAFENINGDWFTGGLLDMYGSWTGHFTGRPEMALKDFGLKWAPHFKPRIDPLLTKDDVNNWNLKYKDYKPSNYIADFDIRKYFAIQMFGDETLVDKVSPKPIPLTSWTGAGSLDKPQWWDNPTVRFHPATQYWQWGRWNYPDRPYIGNAGLGGWSPLCTWNVGGPQRLGGYPTVSWFRGMEPGRTGGCPGGSDANGVKLYVISSETTVPFVVDE